MHIRKILIGFLFLMMCLVSVNIANAEPRNIIKPELIMTQNQDQNQEQGEVSTDAITEKYKFNLVDELVIGRTVSYALLQKFDNKINTNEDLNKYVNLVGQSVAKAASERPKINYKFGIIDTDDINAFAAPGGYVFVTTGLLSILTNENELAAVLAHEIGHIEHGDGLRDIMNHKVDEYAKADIDNLSKNAEFVYDMAYYTPFVGSYVSYYSPTNMAKRQVSRAIGNIPGGYYAGGLGRYAASSAAGAAIDVCADGLKNLAKKLGEKALKRWYQDPLSPEIEFEADGYSVVALSKVGYDPDAMAEFLKVMQFMSDQSDNVSKNAEPQKLFTYRHPPVEERIDKIETLAAEKDLENAGPSESLNNVLKERYKKHKSELK